MAVSKPPITRVAIPSNHFEKGRRFPLSQISEHHIVGDARHAISKAQSQEYSCTFTIAMDGTIYQLVDEADTSWCDNDYRSNGRSITIEHAGGHPNFPYTEAMYQSSIKLHAWLFQQYGNLNCVRHRDIPEIKANPAKATACSGDLQVERIINEARQLLKNGEEEMITKDDAGLLRIAHSEIGGWPLAETHAGKFDKLFMDTYIGTPVKDLIWRQWNNGGNWRNLREKAFADAAELAKRPTQENLDKLKASLQACEVAEKAATGQVVELQKEKAENEQKATGFLQVLANLLKKLKP